MADRSGSGGGPRGLFIKVKKQRGLKNSSRRWIERQLNDPYVHRARMEGYRSRAAFKLTEVNDKHHIVKPGDKVVDLGAAPGGWSQVAVAITGSTDEKPLVVAIDYLEMDQLPGVILFKKDFLDDDAPEVLREALGAKADVVLSDMAAPTIGHRRTDHIRTMMLCETAAYYAVEILKRGGHFLTKTFQGGTEKELLDFLKAHFETVQHVKPPASRAESVELYLLAKGFRGKSSTYFKADDAEA